MTVTMNAMKTVLVIDDEAATLTMFRLFLNAYGYSVLTAENGDIGYNKKQPDVSISFCAWGPKTNLRFRIGSV